MNEPVLRIRQIRTFLKVESGSFQKSGPNPVKNRLDPQHWYERPNHALHWWFKY
jgi:hypothetical protein